MPNTYRRSLPSARKLSASFRGACREGFDYDLLIERLAAIDTEDLPEGASRHAPAYVDAILEVAAQAREAERRDVRRWAQRFLDKRPEFSRTRNGISAMMLESWLAKEQGLLFRQFVETVLEEGDKFLAIFEGVVGKEELRRMRSATAHFCEMEVLASAGQTNGDEILEFTILDCTAKIQERTPEQLDQRPDIATHQTVMPQMSALESLQPETPDEYRRVLVEGGVTRDVLEAIAGDVFSRHEIVNGNPVARDSMGVLWVSEDGSRWVPRLDEFESGGEMPSMLLSDFGTWVVVDEGDGCTRVAASDRLWTIERPYEEFVEAITEAAQEYRYSVAEGDLYIEALLADLAEDFGHEIESELVEADYESRAERDARVEAAIRDRQDEADDDVPALVSKWASDKGMPLKEALRRYRKAGRLVSQQYPDVKEESDDWYRLKVGIFKTMMGKADEADYSRIIRDRGGEPADKALWRKVVSAAKRKFDKYPSAVANGWAVQEYKRRGGTYTSDEGLGEAGDREDEEPEDGEPETTDHTDEPEFYRDDLQAYYDAKIVTGDEPEKAVEKVKKRFGLKKVTVTPSGEVRSPGVVDDPDGPEAPPPPQGDDEAPPDRDDIEGDEPGSSLGAEDPKGKDPAKPEESEDALLALMAEGEALEEAEYEGKTVTLDKPFRETASGKKFAVYVRNDKGNVIKLRFGDADMEIQRDDPDDRKSFRARHNCDDSGPKWKARYWSCKMWQADKSVSDVVEAGPQAADRCEIPDEAWAAYVAEEGLDLDVFEELAGYDPDCWTPPDLALSLVEARDARERLSEERAERAAKFSRLCNMRAADILTLLRGPELRETIATTRRSKRQPLIEAKRRARQVLRLKAMPVDEWADQDWINCREVIRHVERTRRNSAPLVEDGRPTRKTVTLRLHGHNPLTEGLVTYEDFEALYETDDRTFADRILAACATNPDRPVRVAESSLDEAPEFDVLKRCKAKLTDAERQECMDQKAVWHPGNMDKPTPAVWKSVVDGKTWFVTNTHRAYNVAPTLKGAIGRFHRYIKSTA